VYQYLVRVNILVPYPTLPDAKKHKGEKFIHLHHFLKRKSQKKSLHTLRLMDPDPDPQYWNEHSHMT
jgi:hypothetical protein